MRTTANTAGKTVGLVTALALSFSLIAAPAAHAATDSAKPTLTGAPSFTPDTVDTTTGSADSAVRVPLADNVGVTDATLTLTAPDGSSTDVVLDLTAGSAANGTWTGTQTFASVYDLPGRWTPTALTASDSAGNTATITSGLGSGVVMTRTTDGVAPTLVGATSATTTVDTTSDAGTALVRVQAKDDLAGVTGGIVTFTSPDGDTAEGQLTGDPVQGTARDGSWDVPVVFPVRSAPGVWRLSSIDVSDAQANDRYYTTDDAQLPGLAVQVTADDDSGLPTLTSLTVGPATRSTSYGTDGYVYAQVGFGDAVSGVGSVQVTLQRPNGVVDDAETQPVVLADTEAKTGTSRSGTVLVPVYVENFTAGAWKTASVVVTDNAGNALTVPTAQLPGTRTGFTVSTTAADTKAPASSGVAFSPTTVDTRSAAADGTVLVQANDPDAVSSGIAGGSVKLTSPSGLETATATFVTDDIVAGDQASGTFTARFTLPRNAEDGQWAVTSVTVTDAANHSATSTNWSAAAPLTVLGRGRAPAAAPGAPVIGTATLSGTTASVTWTPPTDNGGAVIRRYRVNAVQSDGTVTTLFAATSPLSVPGLRRGANYTFTVAAENSAGVGTASAASNSVSVAPAAPGAPAIGRAELVSGSDTTAAVTWTPPADDGGAAVTGYVVTPLLNGVAQATTTAPANATTAAVANLARGRTYTFRVAAVNAAGTGTPSPSSNSLAIAATVPAAPQVTSTSVTSNAVTVRWSAPDDGGAPITGYQVTGSPAGSCSSTTTSCTVTGLTQDQAYTFTVVARNKVGSGAVSAPSQGAVAGAPQQATSLSVSTPPAYVRYGTALTVTGALVASGRGLGGQVVALQYRRANTNDAWTTWARTTSAGNGGVRFGGLRPPQSISLRLLAQPSAPYVSSASVVRAVNVTRQVTLGTSRKTVKRNSVVTLAGRATPARADDVATLQRWSHGAWRTVARQRLTAQGYHFRVKMTKRGKYAFRVIAAGSGFVASPSPSRALRIR